MDGDARGGAALSVVGVVGVPIAFVGVGERLQDLEPFHADRLVSRVLGMGDVLSLIERAEEAIGESERIELAEKTRLDDFTLEAFRDQLRALRKMGPLEQVLGMIPGLGAIKNAAGAAGNVDEGQLRRVEAIINSMTPPERRNHAIINGSRRKRIARGSGTTVEEVNRMLKQFMEMRRVFKAVGGMAGGGRKGRQRLMGMLKGRAR
jgi:signal recognition particle subunit SRP54